MFSSLWKWLCGYFFNLSSKIGLVAATAADQEFTMFQAFAVLWTAAYYPAILDLKPVNQPWATFSTGG